LAELVIERVPKTAVTDLVARQILTWIQGGLLQPGSQLPPEKELADRMGVSRPSVREALRGLTMLGVIYSRQGKGYFVAEDAPMATLEVESLRETLARLGIFAVLEVSELLEASVAALAVERATNDDLRRLEANLIETAQRIAKKEVAYDVMGGFHLLLADICRNTALVEVTKVLHRLCDPGERPLFEQHLVDEGAILAEHRAIYAAIVARDRAAARQAMEAHLRSQRAEYERLIAKHLRETRGLMAKGADQDT